MNNPELALINSHKIVLEIAEKIRPTIENPLEISSQTLALNLQVLLRGKGDLLAQDAEAYRELIIGLNEKLKVLQISLERIEGLCKVNAELMRAKEIREASQIETLKELEKAQKLKDEYCKKLENDRHQAVCQLISAEQEVKKRKAHENELEFEVSQLKEQLDLREDLLKQLGNENSQGKPGKSTEGSEEFEKMKRALEEALENYEKLNTNIHEEFEKILQDNEELEIALQNANGEIDRLTDIESRILTEKQELEAYVASQEAEIKAYQDLEDYLNSVKKTNEVLKEENKKYQSENSDLAENYKILTSEITELKENTDFQVQSLNSKILTQESEIASSLSKIGQLQKDISNENSQNSLLEKKLKFSDQSAKSLHEELGRVHNNLYDSQKKSESEMEFIANYTLKSSQDRLEQERNLKKFGEIIKEKDSELEILREMIGGLQKTKPNYFAAPNDPVDQALAEYLNQRPEPMEINFIREDQGLYLFGSKRVFIKIENGKIISNF